MSFKDKYPVDNLINENEEEVFKAIDKILDKMDICKCQDCVLDIAAIALNSLEPQYRVFLLRPVHRDEEEVKRHLEKIEEAVHKAIAIVKKRPHHNI